MNKGLLRRVQQKYRDEKHFKKNKTRNTVEAVIIIFSFIFLLYLGTKLTFTESEGIQQLQANDVEGIWMGVTIEIDDALKKNTDEYTGIAIDFNPKPIKILIKTSNENNNLNEDENLKKLINIANEFVVVNNLPSTLQANETYDIIILSKNKEEIMRKEFYKQGR
ncbi:hypothetical protein ACTSEZ_21285 [Metabacillus sp. JX24]|uniref:hypothetical protein n=1 Tax=Metabacillus sp. JX24 TaxID=3240759 RepID=UPI0035109660